MKACLLCGNIPNPLPKRWGRSEYKCDPCNRDYRRANRNKNKKPGPPKQFKFSWYFKEGEHVRARVKEYRKKNLERMLKAAAGWREKNREKIEWYTLKSKCRQYGITTEKYHEMLCSQAGVCAICLKVCSRSKRLSIDHCHESGEARGLLCSLCNAMLGMSKESPDVLRRGAEYIESHRRMLERLKGVK